MKLKNLYRPYMVQFDKTNCSAKREISWFMKAENSSPCSPKPYSKRAFKSDGQNATLKITTVLTRAPELCMVTNTGRKAPFYAVFSSPRVSRGVEKTTYLGALCSVLLTRYHSGDSSQEG